MTCLHTARLLLTSRIPRADAASAPVIIVKFARSSSWLLMPADLDNCLEVTTRGYRCTREYQLHKTSLCCHELGDDVLYNFSRGLAAMPLLHWMQQIFDKPQVPLSCRQQY